MSFTYLHGRDAIEDWLKSMPAGVEKPVRVELRTLLRYMRFLPRERWREPQFAWLHGYPGIGELRFEVRGVPYRPLGFFGPEKHQFTLLIGASKTRKRRGSTKWIPPNACETALVNKRLLSEGKRSVCEFKLQG